MKISRRNFIGTSFTSLYALAGRSKPVFAELTSADPSQKRIALVIGNHLYNGQPTLHSPPYDIAAISKALKSLGYEVQILSNASRDQMDGAMQDFARLSTLCNTSFFYYSGHGIQVDGKNYLVPVDATLLDVTFIANDTVSIERAFNSGGSETAVAVFALDACRDNPFVSALRKTKSTEAQKLVEGLAPIQANDFFLISYATAANKTAREGGEHKLSPYAQTLVSYLTQTDLCIQDIFASTSTSVCNITSPNAPNDTATSCQRPEIYTSLGKPPLYLTNRPDQPTPTIPSPLLTDIISAGPTDPVVAKFLGATVSEFGFGYIYDAPTLPEGRANITPDLNYFISLKERGRALVIAENAGYYSPEEGGPTWNLSYPILDVITRRTVDSPVDIELIVLESRNSREDKTPYIDLMVENIEIITLTVINQGTRPVKDTIIEFDAIGVRDLTDDQIRAIVDAEKPDRKLKYAIRTGPFNQSKRVSLYALLKNDFPDLPMYRYLANRTIDFDKNGRAKITTEPNADKGPQPLGFLDWYKNHPEKHDGANPPSFWIIGRIANEDVEGNKTTVDFAAALDLLAEGVGGGAIEYDLQHAFSLPIDGKSHAFSQKVGKTLKRGSETFRGLFPLVAKTSSFHELRVSLKDRSGKILFASPWIDTHIVVSQNDLKAVKAL